MDNQSFGCHWFENTNLQIFPSTMGRRDVEYVDDPTGVLLMLDLRSGTRAVRKYEVRPTDYLAPSLVKISLHDKYSQHFVNMVTNKLGVSGGSSSISFFVTQ